MNRMGHWFRFYDAALDDPKVQGLSDALFRVWVNLLCVASRNDGLIPEADAPFLLRQDGKKTAAAIQALVERGLVDRIDGRTEPHNWNSRQYKSDVSNERVKRHRERARNGERNVTSQRSVTAPETEAEAEAERPSQERVDPETGEVVRFEARRIGGDR